MGIEKIKNVFSKKNGLFTFIGVIIIILLIIYFKAFFTKGVFFYDKFLKKKVIDSKIHYINEKNNIDIIVDRIDYNNITVTYNLPKNIRKEYHIDFSTNDNWEFNIHSIKDKNGNIIFEGKYGLGSIFLFDKNGEPIIDSSQLGIGSHHDDNYKVSPPNILNFAFSTKDRIRGEVGAVMAAMLLFIITFIDIKYPLFFFTLNHFLDVKDPEPTDFYLTIQKVGWVLMPSIGIILMIAGINI